MSEGLKTWTTPLGVKLTVAGKGGPWIMTAPHTDVVPKREPKLDAPPLKIPLPKGVDAGWYYRNGWQGKTE